jgi:hypothetical protein
MECRKQELLKQFFFFFFGRSLSSTTRESLELNTFLLRKEKGKGKVVPVLS